MSALVYLSPFILNYQKEQRQQQALSLSLALLISASFSASAPAPASPTSPTPLLMCCFTALVFRVSYAHAAQLSLSLSEDFHIDNLRQHFHLKLAKEKLQFWAKGEGREAAAPIFQLGVKLQVFLELQTCCMCKGSPIRYSFPLLSIFYFFVAAKNVAKLGPN